MPETPIRPTDPASPEALLAALDTPEWKRACSTTRRSEGPTAPNRTNGGAPVNLTVLDHIRTGRRRLQLAEQALAAGKTRQAELIREAVAARAALLLGDTTVVRRARCPYCGTRGLLWSGAPAGGKAVCSNRHCTPVMDTPRRWTVEEMLADTGRPVRRRFTSVNAPAPVDLVDLARAVAFLKPTGHPISRTTLSTLIDRYRVRTWRIGRTRTILVSLSDVLVAHALWVQEMTGACDERDTEDRPACLGLTGLYETASTPARTAARTRAARRVCATCPLRSACADALDPPEDRPMADDQPTERGRT